MSMGLDANIFKLSVYYHNIAQINTDVSGTGEKAYNYVYGIAKDELCLTLTDPQLTLFCAPFQSVVGPLLRRIAVS